MKLIKDKQLLILSRSWREQVSDCDVILWASDGDDVFKLIFTHQLAVCFVRREDQIPNDLNRLVINRKQLSLKNLDHQSVDAVYFANQRQQRLFITQASGIELTIYESDINLVERFLMERFIKNAISVSGEWSQKNGFYEMTNPRVKSCEYRCELSHLSLDIETNGLDSMANGQSIYSVALTQGDYKKVLMIDSSQQYKACELISYHIDEKSLLINLINEINQVDADIIIGWNVIDFDFQTLEKRCHKNGLSLTIGREKNKLRLIKTKSGVVISRLDGRIIIDGIELLKATHPGLQSYGLDAVAKHFFDEGKLIDSDTDKVKKINQLFTEDKKALAQYNLQDCLLVERIFKHADLHSFAIERSLLTGLEIGRMGGSVAAFDYLYLPKLHRQGYVAHDIGAKQYDYDSPGGFVLNSQPGLYKNVLLLDFKSLYPSIIRTFLVDPLGLAIDDNDKVPGFDGAHFSRYKNLLPETISGLWAQRDIAKQQQNMPLSYAIKILMNSFYGVLGTSLCRFYNPALASSITKRGHQIIKQSQQYIESLGFKVIYGDTDSIFIHIGDDTQQKQSFEIAHTLVKKLNHWWDTSIMDHYKLESFLEVEFETYFQHFYMPTLRHTNQGSKKRYAGLAIIDAEGSQEKLVIKGLEAVRTDWVGLARKAQIEILQRCFKQQDYEPYLISLIEQLKAGLLDQELVYFKRLRKPLNDYIKNIPPHIQAAKKIPIEDFHQRRHIYYLITINGPEPLDYHCSPIDYEHYIEKQLKPAINGVIQSQGKQIEHLFTPQQTLI